MTMTSPPEATTTAVLTRTEDLVEAIDARIAVVDQELEALEGLREERERLARARRALVGRTRSHEVAIVWHRGPGRSR